MKGKSMETMSMRKQEHQLAQKSAWTFFAALLSSVIEEEISPVQARRITNAIAAFLALAVCAGGSVWIMFIALVWFLVAVYRCSKAGLS